MTDEERAQALALVHASLPKRRRDPRSHCMYGFDEREWAEVKAMLDLAVALSRRRKTGSHVGVGWTEFDTNTT
jgi:hypothetical protein